MLIWCAIVSSGLTAQLVKRGANKGKVAVFETQKDQISLFIWITFFF